MKNLKKLSRKELKDVNGGRKACRHVIQGDDGKWITRVGECNTRIEMVQVGPISVPQKHSYCETGLGEVNVTSNGGVSRC